MTRPRISWSRELKVPPIAAALPLARRDCFAVGAARQQADGCRAEKIEILYLLERGSFGEVVRRIHGETLCLSRCQPPFAPLRELNVESIFRGEEVGKAVIKSETGELPILLGRTEHPAVSDHLGRMYNSPFQSQEAPGTVPSHEDILIQKSSARIVAAIDEAGSEHAGYVFPQSVYAVEVSKPEVDPLTCSAS